MKKISFSVLSDINLLEKVLDKIELFFAENGLKGDWIENLIIASSEIISNAMTHGNKGIKEIPVDIFINIQPSLITMKIKDYGKGFNKDKIDDPLEEENLFKTRGRGILITESLIDSLEFENQPDGTCAVITKRIQ